MTGAGEGSKYGFAFLVPVDSFPGKIPHVQGAGKYIRIFPGTFPLYLAPSNYRYDAAFSF